jgi:YHS domain-containing protein
MVHQVEHRCRATIAVFVEGLMAVDPVCHMTVDEKSAAATSEYNGKTFYFCCRACKTKFDQNPQQFVK